ncbi:MAG: C69 family dipeptidase [Candidatus Eisenbacteria sp.]|nr:C69 family dipeptidase [Candidatus Eisenbacteria bacterium]
MNRSIALNFTLLALLLITPPPLAEGACYSIVVGKAATTDGSVLFGHNEDNNPEDLAGMRGVARVRHAPGEWVTLPGGGRTPQIDTTFAYWCLQMPALDYSDAYLNEHGVALASNNCPSREDMPELTSGGIGGPVLRRLVAERARSAREGVRLVGALVSQFGYTASGRTLVICDPQEGWLVSMVNGKHWVAARVPDDAVAVIANTYTIREVDLADTLNYLGSSDLIDYAVRRGWYEPASGPFNFEAAYADPETREQAGNTHRQWSGLRRICADEVPLPEAARLPFAVRPSVPLSVPDLTQMLRDHYEGTPYRRGSGYDGRSPHEGHTPTICSPRTNSSSIFQLRSAMPIEIGAVWWLALWQPCSTPYLPFYPGAQPVPAELDLAHSRSPGDVIEGNALWELIEGDAPGNGMANAPGTLESAYSIFGRLALWVEADYPERIAGAIALWQESEEASYRFQGTLERYALMEWKAQPAMAAEILKRHSLGTLIGASQRARALMLHD